MAISRKAGRIPDKGEDQAIKCDCGFEGHDEIRERREAKDGWWYKKEW